MSGTLEYGADPAREMDVMDDEESVGGATASRWEDRPTAQQRTGVQHAVNALLDALAPERPPARGGETMPDVQRVRTPRGCILQGATRAVSVSWFPPGASDLQLGELQIVTWSGRVARPGAARAPGAGSGAETLAQEILTPALADGTWEWKATDGARYTREALAARCEAMLVG